MGLLDELRAKAEAQRSTEQVEQEARRKRELQFKQEVRPRFKALYNYLLELVEHLNYLKADIVVGYELPGSDDLHQLHQQDYRITANSSDEITEFNLRCRATGTRPIYLRLSEEQNTDKLLAQLRHYNLDAALRTVGAKITQASNIIDVTPEIPIAFTFLLDPEQLSITIMAQNFPKLGKVKRHFMAEEINDQWMDDVADMIVRKKDILTTLPITEEERQRIKEEIRRRALEDEDDSGWSWYKQFKKGSHA